MDHRGGYNRPDGTLGRLARSTGDLVRARARSRGGREAAGAAGGRGERARTGGRGGREWLAAEGGQERAGQRGGGQLRRLAGLDDGEGDVAAEADEPAGPGRSGVDQADLAVDRRPRPAGRPRRARADRVAHETLQLGELTGVQRGPRGVLRALEELRGVPA